MRITTERALAAGLLALVGCASTPPPSEGLLTVVRPDMPGLTPRSPETTAVPPVDWAHLSRVDALALARAQSPRAVAARKRIGVARAELVTAETYPLNPTLDVTGAQNRLTNNGRDGSIGTSLTQGIETGGQVQRRVDVAAAGRDITLAEVSNEERLLARDVSLAYGELVYRGERLGLASAALARAKAVLELAERRVAAKDIAESEAALVRLAERQALVEVDTAARERESTRIRLLSLLGEPASRMIAPASTLAAPSSASLTKEDLEARGLARRADLYAAKLGIERAERKGDLARAEVWPTLGVSLTYQRSVLHVGGVRESDDDLGLGLSVPLPLFDRRQGPKLEAAAERDRAEAELDSLRIDVRREIDVALNRLELARSRVDLYDREIVPLAEKNVELGREAYRLGKSGTLEVLRAQDELEKTKLARLDALYEYDQARIELATASAEPLGE